MQTLRRMTFLARLVLAAFMLSLGVAAASPAVKPQALEMVCSGGVYKLVAPDGQARGAASSAPDCPQCLPAGLPPPAPLAVAGPDWAGAVLPQRPQSMGAVAVSALPPPARAPPVASA